MPTFVAEIGVAAGVVTAIAGALILLWRIAKGIGLVATISQQVANEFDPNRPGGTLPSQVQRIETQVERIADGIDSLANETATGMRELDSRVTSLEQWRDEL